MKTRAKIIGMLVGVVMVFVAMMGVSMPVGAANDAAFDAIKATNWWKNKVTSGKNFKKCSNGKTSLDDATCNEYKSVCKAVKKAEGNNYWTSYNGVCTVYAQKMGDASGQTGSGTSGGGSGNNGSGSGSSSSNGSGSSSSSGSGSSNKSGSGGSSQKSGSGSKGSDCDGVETSLFGCVETGSEGEGIFFILNLILTVMTYGVGVLATVGIVWAGYQYLTAKDDVAQMQKAKSRIFQVVIGLVAYSIMWSILQFILPGGVFGNGS